MFGLVTLKLPGFDEPVSAQMISLPDDGGQPLMNGLHLRQGRLPAAPSREEAGVGGASVGEIVLKLGRFKPVEGSGLEDSGVGVALPSGLLVGSGAVLGSGVLL